jgi:hypothetical protein
VLVGIKLRKEVSKAVSDRLIEESGEIVRTGSQF